MSDYVTRLEHACDAKWPVIGSCRARARTQRQRLLDAMGETPLRFSTGDASLVVFGSLAREEWTESSDLDWTLLVDGKAEDQHLDVAQQFAELVRQLGIPGPGPTGTFGSLGFSHDLVHMIGGEADSNRNMTQRLLLLLESATLGNGEAYDRVVRMVLRRYLNESRRAIVGRDPHFKVPRFLLNDVIRFWRTMAVDFASKQRERQGSGWGLRNAKLRMSRKLIAAAGLLLCYSCATVPRPEVTQEPGSLDAALHRVQEHLRSLVGLTPLELLAKTLLEYEVPVERCHEIFSAYDRFLALLEDQKTREALKGLRAEDADKDPLFEIVKEQGRAFQAGLTSLFFDHPPFGPMTRKYGLF